MNVIDLVGIITLIVIFATIIIYELLIFIRAAIISHKEKKNETSRKEI